MLRKDNSSKKSRVLQNYPNSNKLKKKTSCAQTDDPDFFHISNKDDFIKSNGEISKYVQDSYNRAVDYVNKWNTVMNKYLKGRKYKKLNGNGCNDCGDTLEITTIPNFMSFFNAIIQEVKGDNAEKNMDEHKNSWTQTKSHSTEKSTSFSRTRISDVLTEIDEDVSDNENLQRVTSNIQESQYRNYKAKHRNSPIPNENEHILPDDINPSSKTCSRHSEGNIRKTSSNIFGKELTYAGLTSPAKANMNSQNIDPSPLKRNQSLGNFSKPLSVIQQKRPPVGILSANGMIASEINAKGTPLIVKNMFEEIQNPLGLFVSKGNILNNISRSRDSSGSSVILSDKDSREFNIGDTRFCERNTEFNYRRNDLEFLESDPSTYHPLKLNERDLNTRDKNFIKSIGIFTDAGDLKPNAKTYLEKKEDVKRSPFRIPRVSQLHRARDYKSNSCTSGSLFSDIMSPQNSDIRSDE